MGFNLIDLSANQLPVWACNIQCGWLHQHTSFKISFVRASNDTEQMLCCCIALFEYVSIFYLCRASSAKNISVQAEWLCQSGRAPSEPSETPRWRITPPTASIQRVAFHIALLSLFHWFFSFCRSPILNDHSGVVANCDHTSEWVHWVRACIGISMLWVTRRKSLLAFLLPAPKMQFSLY